MYIKVAHDCGQPSPRHGKRGGTVRGTLTGLLLAATGWMASPVAAADVDPVAPAKPNIVLIFTDDQGYQDLGCFGSPLIRTPHLDRMAAEGMKFTDFYSANSVCSPSRAALLTGCYPTRVNIPGVLFPRDHVGLNPNELTLPELLLENGYATACFGKWHLGHKPPFLPTQHGFQEYLGIPYSNDMTIDVTARLADDVLFREGVTRERLRADKPRKNWVPLMRNQEVIEYPVDQSRLTQRYTDEALRFIRANQDRPFFLYLPHTMPHIPLFASEAFRGKSPRGLYGDVIEEIDHSTGRILKLLADLNLDERTLVIYTSDNGPWKLSNGRGGSASPLRGYKFSTWEGGMRVPCLMRWPTKIPAGSVCHEIAATIDLLPTLVTLAGGKIPTDRVIDGKNIKSLLFSEPGASSPHPYYYYYKGRNLEAVRSGPWKLRVAGQETGLYHLGNDISESTNLAAMHPERVEILREQMRQFDRQLKQQARPVGRMEN